MSTINTNIPSLVAARVLNKNNELMTRSLERLSTGLRINRGADDPAGLIASETLRGQKAAIAAAIENAGRANNFLSVAEGALQEVSSLMVELEDLIDRSASESGLTDEEIAANQLQIDSILDTINRIATTTTFAGNKLLDGSLDYVTSGVTASQIGDVTVNSARLAEGGYRTVTVNVTASAQTAQLVHTLSSGSGISGNVTLSIGGNKGTDSFSFASGTSLDDVAAAVNESTELTGVSAYVSGASIYFNSTRYGSDQFVSVEAVSGTFTVTGGDSSTKDYGVDATVEINGTTADTKGLVASVRSATLDVELTLTESYGGGTTNTPTTFYITGGGATFSISPDVTLAGQVAVGIRSTATTSLGSSTVGRLSSLGSGQANALASGNFATAQEIVRLASEQVASLRGRLGAIQQNTLTATVNSLQVAYENVTAAESAIRDTDFASETSNLTRAQILVQTATATLGLANAAPQNVLSLLR